MTNKSISAKAPLSKRAKELFDNPTTRKQMQEALISGQSSFIVDGTKFIRRNGKNVSSQEGRSP